MLFYFNSWTYTFNSCFLVCCMWCFCWANTCLELFLVVCVKCMHYTWFEVLIIVYDISDDWAEGRLTFSREGWVIIKKLLWCQTSKMRGKTLFSSLMRTSSHDWFVSASSIILGMLNWASRFLCTSIFFFFQ